MLSRRIQRSVALVMAFTMLMLTVACGGGTATGVTVVPVDEAAAIFADQPDDLVVLDVRTPEEFDAGHLEGATLIDFYENDFELRIAELDRDQPYLLYCRSGNRSGTTRAIMEDLGFTNVTDVGGGINAWIGAGHPVVQ